MPHVVLTLGEVEGQSTDNDGIETISITGKIRSNAEVKSNWLIPYSDLEIGEAIGRGNLGSYYKGKLKGKEVYYHNEKLILRNAILTWMTVCCERAHQPEVKCIRAP